MAAGLTYFIAESFRRLGNKVVIAGRRTLMCGFFVLIGF